MNPIRKKLLATAAAGLVLTFGAASAQAQEKKPAAPDLPTITSLYHTKDSKALSALEERLNKERPKGAPRVVFVDPDIMATWLHVKGDVTAYPQMTAEYLKSKNVTGYSEQAIESIAELSASMHASASAPIAPPGADLSKAACVVLPYNPNLSADAFMRSAFELANPKTGQEENVSEGVKFQSSITRAQMEEIIDAREAWACFGTSYVAQVAETKDFDQIMALHRLEVFQDVGGLMQAVKDGADPSVITQFADFRATAAAMTSHERGGIFAPTDPGFYGSVIRETSPALNDLKARIDAIGVEKFRALPGSEMVKLADDITAKSALTPEQATHVMGYAMLGEGYFRSLQVAHADPASIEAAKAAVLGVLKGEDDAVQRFARPMTEDEEEAALSPDVTARDVYDYLQNQIFGDKAVQKNPEDLGARLRVHQELIDRTRGLLDQHPEAEGVIRQMLQGIFLSDPTMPKAPPPAPPPSRAAPLVSA